MMDEPTEYSLGN